MKLLLDLIALYADIKLFHFFSSPGSFAHIREAQLDAGIKPETPNVNDAAQVFPPKMLAVFSRGNLVSKCIPMKRVFFALIVINQKTNIGNFLQSHLFFCEQRKLHNHLTRIEN